jgi:hypothetical protein
MQNIRIKFTVLYIKTEQGLETSLNLTKPWFNYGEKKINLSPFPLNITKSKYVKTKYVI